VFSANDDTYRWVQTIDQGNQTNEIFTDKDKSFSPPRFTKQKCVDPCPANDNEPYYVPGHNREPELFYDGPSRVVPTKAMGTTRWRAVTSMVVINNNSHKVSLIESLYWGFDLTPEKKIRLAPLRPATDAEINTHLKLLREGKGKDGKSFVSTGWNFNKGNRVPCAHFKLKL